MTKIWPAVFSFASSRGGAPCPLQPSPLETSHGDGPEHGCHALFGRFGKLTVRASKNGVGDETTVSTAAIAPRLAVHLIGLQTYTPDVMRSLGSAFYRSVLRPPANHLS